MGAGATVEAGVGMEAGLGGGAGAEAGVGAVGGEGGRVVAGAGAGVGWGASAGAGASVGVNVRVGVRVDVGVRVGAVACGGVGSGLDILSIRPYPFGQVTVGPAQLQRTYFSPVLKGRRVVACFQNPLAEYFWTPFCRITS